MVVDEIIKEGIDDKELISDLQESNVGTRPVLKRACWFLDS